LKSSAAGGLEGVAELAVEHRQLLVQGE
jgi:hypothetical protein